MELMEIFLGGYNMIPLPFIEENVERNIFIREFHEETDSIEFVWHRDREDRIVESIGETDWEIQIDNQLPQSLNQKVFIPSETYHRLIKGTGNLKITLIKLELVNGK
jgi:hypothetical protein